MHNKLHIEKHFTLTIYNKTKTYDCLSHLIKTSVHTQETLKKYKLKTPHFIFSFLKK